tara:strand:- start:7409 stop:8242 length:834 start_codon:yes stop_codon:yes gene_type:complete
MKLEKFINLKKIYQNLNNYSDQYKKSDPFPHIVIEEFLQEKCILNTLKGYKNVNWATYSHFNENKSGNKNTNFDPQLKNTIDALNSDEFLKLLEKITGIRSLIADHDLGSGGVHRSSRGGFLNIHADFTVHPYKKNWHRRVNLLVYLNEKWEDNWGGKLELWDKKMNNCVKKISPIFNRCVIFNTDYDSFHGHPEPMTCPDNIYRKSIALYYYTEAKNDVKTIATNYKARPKDKLLKRIFIFFDKTLISIFHFLKSKLKISDRWVTKVMDFLNSRRK